MVIAMRNPNLTRPLVTTKYFVGTSSFSSYALFTLLFTPNRYTRRGSTPKADVTHSVRSVATPEDGHMPNRVIASLLCTFPFRPPTFAKITQ